MPAPLVKNAGSPTFKAGLFKRFIRRSDKTLTIVMDIPIMSIGKETGVP
jgi:hypothetical protein